jgi:hypothetical protein
MKKKTLLDITKKVMSKKSEMKLSDVVANVWKAGFKGTDSSRYIAVYQCLREYPEVFEHTNWSTYRMRSKELVSATKDHETIKSLMVQILGRKGMSTVQLWKALQKEGVYITYRAANDYLRNDPRFGETDSIYYSMERE